MVSTPSEYILLFVSLVVLIMISLTITSILKYKKEEKLKHKEITTLLDIQKANLISLNKLLNNKEIDLEEHNEHREEILKNIWESSN